MKLSVRLVALVSWGLFMIVACASADSQQVERGDRVRITSPRFVNPIIGEVHDIDLDSLALTPTSAAPRVAVSLQEITMLEVGRGRPSKAGWGAVAGAVIFAVAGAKVGERACDQGEFAGSNYCAPVGAVVYGIMGAGLGALVGLFIRGEERWEKVPPEQIRFGVSLQRGSTWGAVLSVSF